MGVLNQDELMAGGLFGGNDAWSHRALIPMNRRVALLGDSRVNQSSGADGWRNTGFIHWLRMLTGQRFDIKYDTSLGVYATQPADGSGDVNPVHDNFGVFGNTTPQMLDRLDKILAATDAGTFIFFGGINDRLYSINLEQSKANVTAMLDKLAAAGRVVIIVAEMPSGTATATNMRLPGSALREHMAYRHWLMQQRDRRGVIVVDVWPVLGDLTTNDNNAADVRPDVTYDNRHPSVRGSFLIATALVPAIERLFTPVSLMTIGAADRWADGLTPSGALNTNPNLAGVGGDLGTNSSGQLAANWQGTGGSGSTGTAAVFSKGLNALGNPVQHVAISGTPTGAAATCNYNILRSISRHDMLSPGDIIEGWADIDVAPGLRGIIQLALRIDVMVDGVQSSISDGAVRNADQILPDTGFAGVMRTPRFKIPDGDKITLATLSLQAFMVPGTPADLVMDIAFMALRRG